MRGFQLNHARLKRFLAGTACALGLLLTATAAQADSITWTLQDVTFSDGGTASGTFTTDSTSGDLLSWDITTIQTTTSYTGWEYTPESSNLGADTSDSFTLDPDGLNSPTLLLLTFENPLTAAGLDAIVTGSSSIEEGQNCCQTFIRTVTSGDAISSAPEPAEYAMLFGGLGLTGLVTRRTRKGLGARTAYPQSNHS